MKGIDIHVLDLAIPKDAYTALNLSEDNPELGMVDLGSADAIQRYIDKKLSQNQAHVAFGGYLEPRAIYRRSTHFADAEIEERNIHLGMDLWCPAGTPVLACLDGVVHSFQDNTAFGDYGPTVILEHRIESEVFYSLYGHLTRESLDGMTVGQRFLKGMEIARIGSPHENGDYAPHLHFQLILDLQGRVGDFPGVCAKSDLPFFKSNCPDPNLLLHLF